MLMHIVSAKEKSFEEFPLSTEGKDLATRVNQLVRIVRKQIEVQAETCKLLAIEIAQPRPDSNVASWTLYRRKGSGINRDRKARANEAGWETCLTGRCGVGGQTVET